MRTATKRNRTRDRHNERGAIIIMVCVAMILMVISVAMVVDIGNARRLRSQSQHAVDAAVLAAINVAGRSKQATGDYDWEQASGVAKAMLKQNLNISESSWAGCLDPKHTVQNIRAASDVLANNECISFQLDGSKIDARVKMPTQLVDTIFGGIAGMDSIEVNASAGADGAPGICDPTDPAGCVGGEPPSTSVSAAEWCTTMVDEFTYYFHHYDSCSPYRGGNRAGFVDTACEVGYVNYWNPLSGQVESFYMDEYFIYIQYWDICSEYVDDEGGSGPGGRDTFLATWCLSIPIENYYNNWFHYTTCLPYRGGDREAWFSTSTTTTSPPGSSTTQNTAPTTIRLTS